MAATAIRVFGNPITHGTRAQRALAAKNYLNADGKLDQVLLQSNQSIKVAAGKTNAVAAGTTICKVCNATGSTIRYVTAYDWSGKVAGHYPVTIQNGQWAVFEHVGTTGANQGSIGALVYNIDDFCDSMISWNNPWKTTRGGNNTAYCEMNDPGYFDRCDWDEIYAKLIASGSVSKTSMVDYETRVTIDAGGNSPSYKAIFYVHG
ncbi:23 kDa jasmonate-induced protein [Lactuca sativa]|uniref:Uncharacterized protein n=1 Tax=Lactuca sativa TaxID=4236 RepID=A0A9R1WUU6_LACSA|nr:23 kDa jasmonate-induced protein [Lactuca sativa]KAJ0186392.1 hypothetical protein LSAT_V11C900475430 [Lactuca sativa]